MTHKLLLADDSVTIQRVIELTFADEDIDVTVVGDGQLAIERLDADPPDIVLADIDMPKRDGYEVAAYIKSRPKLAHIPVVLLTGAFEQVDLARATTVGSSEVLAKPFEPQMVINKVKQLLGKKPEDPRNDALGRPPAAAPQKPAMAPKPAARSMAPQNPQANLQVPVDKPASDQLLQPVSLDDYFDQLDAAFSNLQPGAAAAAPEHDNMNGMDWPAVDQAAPETMHAAPAPPVSTQKPRQAEPLITPPASPPPVQQTWEPETLIASAKPAPPPRPASPPPVIAKPVAVPTPPPAAPQPPAGPATNPFASLSSGAKAEAAAAAARPAAPVITEDVIEEVVARVLQRLSDRVVRETVTEIVLQKAERAVREEIEKIRTGGQ